MSANIEDFMWLKAGILARERWPKITQETQIYVSEWSSVIVPIVLEIPVAMGRIGDMASSVTFEQEEIMPDRVKGLLPIAGIGYGPRSDMLVIVLEEQA